MTGEARKVWYGTLAFWVVVAGLITARVVLLDPSQMRPFDARIAAQSTTTLTMAGMPPSE